MVERGIYNVESHPDSWIVVTKTIDVPMANVPVVKITGRFYEGVIIAVPSKDLQPWSDPIPDAERIFGSAERVQLEGD